MSKNYRSVYVIIILVVLFTAPGILAYFIYTNVPWLGTSTTNKGTLLQPPVLFSKPTLRPMWRLVLWSPSACDQACIQQLDQLARVRLALGRRLYDVQFLLLLGHDSPKLSSDWVKNLHELDVSVLKLNADEQLSLPRLTADSEIFVQDPGHYLVLSYPMTTKPDDIFHDIKRLLRVKE